MAEDVRDEMFEKWLAAPNDSWNDDPLSVGYIQMEAWQAATASAEAKYRPVIEKLVEALEFYANPDEYCRERKGPSGQNWIECDEGIDAIAVAALAEAAPLLRGK